MSNAITVYQDAPITTNADSDEMLVHLFVGTKRSEKTRIQYSHSTTMLRDFVGKPLGFVTYQDAQNYLNFAKERYASLHSIKLHINVAKALFAFGVKLNYLRTNVFAIIKPDVAPEITHKRILTEEQTLKLIDAPKRSRDKLLLRLIYAAGLRVSEVCGLVWGDLPANGVLHIRLGKGQKERFVTLSDSMVEKLAAFRGDAADSAPMFRSQKGGHLDDAQVQRIVRASAKAVGITGDVSPHWLRHSHASHAIDRGANIVEVRDTLGHSSIATTNKYLHSKRSNSSALRLAV